VTTRTSILGDVGNLAASPGSTAWATALRLELQQTLKDRQDSENHLQRWCDVFRAQSGWRALVDRQGRRFTSWDAFCRHPQPEGLGKSAEAIDAELLRRQGRESDAPRDAKGQYLQSKRDNVTFGRGNQRRYILARLARDANDPELEADKRTLCSTLLQKVTGCELSAHQAALQAGYHARMLSVPIDDLNKLAKTLKRQLGRRLATLIKLLQS
jgi:hypothetical protein